MARSLLVLAIVMIMSAPARAETLELRQLYDRAAALVRSLIGEQADDEIIAPPSRVDRGMIVAPPASGALRTILPRSERPVRPD